MSVVHTTPPTEFILLAVYMCKHISGMGVTSSLHSLVPRLKVLGVQFIDAYEQEIAGKMQK